MVLGRFDSQRYVLAEAHGGPFLGLVHSAVNELSLWEHLRRHYASSPRSWAVSYFSTTFDLPCRTEL